MTLPAQTVIGSSLDNPADTADNRVNHVLEAVLRCFVEWLEQSPSDQKNHQILLALGRESLKKAKRGGQYGIFDKREIAAAAGVEHDQIDLNSWFRWTDICKFWEARRDQYIDYASVRGIEHCPLLQRKATAGGRNMLAEHWLEIEKFTTPGTVDSLPGIEGAGGAPSNWRLSDEPFIRYIASQPGEVACAWWLKPWLKTGSFVLRGWRRWSVIGIVLSLALPTLAAGLYGYLLLAKPDLISRQTLATATLLFIFAYAMWRVLVRPVLRLLDDRIIAADAATALNEEPAQLEVMKEGDARLIRLVRYTSACGICGATVSLGAGDPAYPRRLIGRCSESPREHVFSFDRVTTKGRRLNQHCECRG